MTQPLDVLKTKMMTAKPGEYKSIFDAIVRTAKSGPMGFYKGFLPATLRPNTILTFIFLEQLRLNFGYYLPEDKQR